MYSSLYLQLIFFGPNCTDIRYACTGWSTCFCKCLSDTTAKVPTTILLSLHGTFRNGSSYSLTMFETSVQDKGMASSIMNGKVEVPPIGTVSSEWMGHQILLRWETTCVGIHSLASGINTSSFQSKSRSSCRRMSSFLFAFADNEFTCHALAQRINCSQRHTSHSQYCTKHNWNAPRRSSAMSIVPKASVWKGRVDEKRGRRLTSGEFVVKSNDQDLDNFNSVLVLG